MRRAGGLPFVIASVMLAWAPPVGTVPQAWAQAPPKLEGLYILLHVDRCGVTCEPDPQKMEETPSTLYFSKYSGKSVYYWVDDHEPDDIIEYSEYQGTTNLTLCASKYTGEVDQRTVPLRVILKTPVARTSNVQFKYTLERKSTTVGNPKGAPTYCPARTGDVKERGLTASVAWERPLLLALQSQQTPRRVNGQLLVSVREDEEYHPSEADKGLWTCLVSKGLPRLEFVEQPESLGQRQRIFVWPDGHFQAIFRGGATYGWGFAASSCRQQAQTSNEKFRVPENGPRTEEKVVLGCFIMKGEFQQCDSWWLLRP